MIRDLVFIKSKIRDYHIRENLKMKGILMGERKIKLLFFLFLLAILIFMLEALKS